MSTLFVQKKNKMSTPRFGDGLSLLYYSYVKKNVVPKQNIFLYPLVGVNYFFLKYDISLPLFQIGCLTLRRKYR